MEPFEGIDDDTAFVQNVTIHIVKSQTDSFKVTMLKMVNGRNRRSADTLASLINYNVVQKDSLLLIDKGIAITRTDKFRNQRIVLTVYVPVGKQIRVDRSVGWGNHIRLNGPWNNNEWDVDFEDVEQGWDENIDYIMKDDGLYSLDGTPADTDKHETKINEKGTINIQEGNTKVRIDKNGVIINNVNEDNYRYNKNTPAVKTDTIQLKIDADQKRTKDSLQKAKEKIDKQLEKLGATADINPVNSYSLPAYNPLLILN